MGFEATRKIQTTIDINKNQANRLILRSCIQLLDKFLLMDKILGYDRRDPACDFLFLWTFTVLYLGFLQMMRDNFLNCRLDNSSTYDYVRVANE